MAHEAMQLKGDLVWGKRGMFACLDGVYTMRVRRGPAICLVPEQPAHHLCPAAKEPAASDVASLAQSSLKTTYEMPCLAMQKPHADIAGHPSFAVSRMIRTDCQTD